jgi:hypothetical protein
VEGTKGKGGKRESSGRGEIGGVRKRIRSITTVHNSTKDLGSEYELVQFSIDQSKPLLTVQIIPKNQADPIPSLVDLGATANFISPTIVEKLKIPKMSLSHP